MRRVMSLALVLACCLMVRTASAEDKKPEDTPQAAKTRKLLKTKITTSFKDYRLSDVVDELKEEVKGLRFLIDSKGGVSRNIKLTGKVEDGTVEELLDMMFKKNGLGYVVISNKRDAYNGLILIKMGKERGYPIEK